MKKTILILVLLLTSVAYNNVKAQNYSAAVGARGGSFLGFTGKYFLSDDAAAEGILALGFGGVSITGLYEIHKDAFGNDDFKWFFGGGTHVGFWKGGLHNPWLDEDKSYTVVGLDGIFGLEYTLPSFPLSFSVDVKPVFNFTGKTGVYGDLGAASIRYVFN